METIDRQIAALQEERSKWGSLLVLKTQLGEATTTPEATNGSATPTMREAIKKVLEDQTPGTSLKLSVIGAEIIARGWMEDVKKDWHRLQMMASVMKKQGQLERPQMGFYRLPLKDSTPDGDETERQGILATPPGTGPGQS
jgi:hypothetical protein